MKVMGKESGWFERAKLRPERQGGISARLDGNSHVSHVSCRSSARKVCHTHFINPNSRAKWQEFLKASVNGCPC